MDKDFPQVCFLPTSDGSRKAYGVYFPSTDLFVTEMGMRGTGKPQGSGVAWYPQVAAGCAAAIRELLANNSGNLSGYQREKFEGVAARLDSLGELPDKGAGGGQVGTADGAAPTRAD